MGELWKHEYSQAFETASAEDREAIKTSIATNGYDPYQPIVMYDGRILDGYHRYLACKELGIKPPQRKFEGSDEDAINYIFLMNMDRRHLTQRAKVLSLILKNDFLPAGKRLNKGAIMARAGKESPILVDQLSRLASQDIEIARKVARGETPAATAIRKVLREVPDGGHQGRELILRVTSKKHKDGFWEARETLLLTQQQAINKAIALFMEYAKQTTS